MSLRSELYLALVIVAFLVFTLSLAYCSIAEARRRHRDEGNKQGRGY